VELAAILLISYGIFMANLSRFHGKKNPNVKRNPKARTQNITNNQHTLTVTMTSTVTIYFS